MRAILYLSLFLPLLPFQANADQELQLNFFVSSANIMHPEDESKLSEKLDKIIPMKKDELREYYKALRRSGKEKHGRGAGLGFLEMAKKVHCLWNTRSPIWMKNDHFLK